VYGSFLTPLKAQLNPICHLLTLLGTHHILHVSRIRVKLRFTNDRPSHLFATRFPHICLAEGEYSLPFSLTDMTYFIQKKKVPNFLLSASFTHANKIHLLQSERTSTVRKVASHFEYLKNRSRDLDVTWQPVRGDLTAHP